MTGGPHVSGNGVWIDRNRVTDPALLPVIDFLESGVRLGREEGITLLESSDLLTVGTLANRVREARNGNAAYFNVNRHINHTNVCISGCSFCAFSRKPGQAGAYRMRPEEAAALAVPPEGAEWDEIHMVGGLDPEFSFSDCLALVRAVKEANPAAHLKAFTLVEIDDFARKEKLPPREILLALREAGVGSLPGGGAEILGERLRRGICPRKISGRRWLELAREAHSQGLRTNCTMLYGHVESVEDRVDHILRLRDLQEETGGFMAFIPLQFNKANTPYEDVREATGVENLKTLAASRLLFDNIDHIKVYWIMVGLKIAQAALWFGADDIDGTIVEERITHEAGASTPVGVTRDELLTLIRSAGRVPVRRDTLYRTLREYA